MLSTSLNMNFLLHLILFFQVVEVNEPEIGSVFATGSKKQNLNHLLNFHYTPRVGAVSGNDGNGQTYSHPVNWLGTQKHKYNKEHFLQAKYVM